VHASYEVPVDTLSMSLGCSLITQGKGIRHVNVYYDASAGWLVDFPDSANAGPYALRQTATGYAAGSTSAPMGVPLVGWSVDCSTGLIQVSGISGDCINGGGSVQFSGQIQECALWVAPPGGLGRSFIGNTLNIQARGTCRENPSYRFTLTRPNLTTSVVQDWSPSDTFVWNTSSEMMGEYSFLVTVRSDGKPDESVTLPWRLIPPP
jgi:hypothetical protein